MLKRIAALVALVLLAGSVVVILCLHLRQSECGPIADVTWRVGGSPMSADVTIRDTERRPVSGVRVHVDNNSGGSGATTDADGHARICLGEPDFAGLELNGVR